MNKKKTEVSEKKREKIHFFRAAPKQTCVTRVSDDALKKSSKKQKKQQTETKFRRHQPT